MRPTATAVAQSFSARIQVKTYPFSSILSCASSVRLDILRAISEYTKMAAFAGLAILDTIWQRRIFQAVDLLVRQAFRPFFVHAMTFAA
jgi:hypothetical protein